MVGSLGSSVFIIYAYGVSWLFLFGDDPWPETASLIILFFGFFLVIASFLVGLVLGWSYGKQLDQTPGANVNKIRKRAFLWLGLGVGVSTSLIASLYFSSTQQTEKRLQTDKQEINFSQLQEELYAIENIIFSGWQNGETEVQINFEGKRVGKYKLYWTLEEQNFGHTIEKGVENLYLNNGPHNTKFTLKIEQISQVYSDVVLAGKGRVLVEESFLFKSTLEPVLNDSEIKGLPQNEIQNLERGFSSLGSDYSIKIPIRFILQKK